MDLMGNILNTWKDNLRQEQNAMTEEDKLSRSIDSLTVTAMRVKAERDKFRNALVAIAGMLNDLRYNPDGYIDPRQLDAAIDIAEKAVKL